MNLEIRRTGKEKSGVTIGNSLFGSNSITYALSPIRYRC